MKYSAQIEKIVPLISHIFIPALIFAAALLSFLLHDQFSATANMTFHTMLFLLGSAAVMTLLYYNQNKPIFFILCIVMAYILINVIKNKFGADYLIQPGYQNLMLFLPLNLALFFFWPNQRLLNRVNVYLLLTIFIQYSVAEQLSRQGISLNWGGSGSLSGLALVLAIGGLIAMFVRTTLSGTIMDYTMFFAALSVTLACFYSGSASGLSVLFAAALLILLIAIALNLYMETYRDSLTGLASRNSYILHTKDFPLKYCIGIISIDDFDKLSVRFGRYRLNQIIKLMAAKMTEYEKEDCIYRYSTDEFVIIFKNMDKSESFEQLEHIRRAIAAASFLLSPKRPALKLTVSASVSEKKRSDANSYEVLVRAHKVLEKTRSFSHNVTSKA